MAPLKKKILPAVIEYIHIHYGYTRSDLIRDFNSKVKFIILTAPRLSHWIQGDKNDLLTKKDYLDVILQYILDAGPDLKELAAQLRESHHDGHDEFYRFVKQFDPLYQEGNYALYLEKLIRVETDLFNQKMRSSSKLIQSIASDPGPSKPKLTGIERIIGFMPFINRRKSSNGVNDERANRWPGALKPLFIILSGGLVITTVIFFYRISPAQPPALQRLNSGVTASSVVNARYGSAGATAEAKAQASSPPVSFLTAGKSEDDGFIYEAENVSHTLGLTRLETKSNASGQKCIHIGPDVESESEGVGAQIEYSLSLPRDLNSGILEIWYADDRGGNLMNIYLDKVRKGCFRTETTGGWEHFQMDTQKINLGPLKKGVHHLKIEMVIGGSWGALLDYFKISAVKPESTTTRAYRFVKSLINPNTGLVQSTINETHFTTLKKNSLAALAFIHQHDLALAERIFSFFESKYIPDAFNGFNKNWDPETGLEGSADHWAGDNALLLLALNNYREVTGSYGKYRSLAEGLAHWLADNTHQDVLIAEAYIYAALKSFAKARERAQTDPAMDRVLLDLQNDFQTRAQLDTTLDHIALNALCFSDVSGFRFIHQFEREETWSYNGTKRRLLALFTKDDFVSVETTAQTFWAWKLRRSDLKLDLADLGRELNQLWLYSGRETADVTNGLPYYLSEKAPGWPGSFDEPIIDSTCYLLFADWSFNPLAPQKN